MRKGATTMNGTNRSRTIVNTMSGLVRAGLLAAMFIVPLAGFAAKADEGARGGNGVGFVLYVTLMRP